MRFIVSLVAVLTALGVGAFVFLSAERTIAVPALAIASPQVAPESRSVAAPSRHTPDSQFAQVGAAETPGASGAPTRVEQESQAILNDGDQWLVGQAVLYLLTLGEFRLYRRMK